MCGFAGFVAARGGIAEPERIARRMADQVVHRGPDDGGAWADAETGVGLGHRRLSIIDLSPAGHQPAQSASGRFVIAYNGEIYNHGEIRRALEERAGGSIAWRGTSDTEVLLEAIEAWGLPGALERCVGMFALALWDRRTRVLSLARDRLGEKPLYYGWSNGAFLFGSELKSLRAYPDFSPELSRKALVDYFCQNAVPAPWTIYQDVYKLSPGHILTLKVEDGPVEASLRIDPYWTLQSTLSGPQFRGSAEEASAELERRLKAAVGLQMVADVPVGAFLSGGIDSSLIVSMMQEQSRRPVKTFSIGFEEAEYNEAHHAAAVASHIGTEHTELFVTSRDSLEMIPRLAEIWDEPFADNSQIPTAILSTLTREHVTVSLSGDAGDELFGGYERYRAARMLEQLPAKALISKFLANAPLKMVASAARRLPHPLAKKVTAKRLELLGETLAASDGKQRYLQMFWSPERNRELVTNGGDVFDVETLGLPEQLDHTNMVGAIDALTYLPDDILVKVDRAAMATSLETRVPMLDHRVVEFAYTLPEAIKLRGGASKWPLRELLYRRVPRSLIDRPKMGFGVPIAEWLRGPLKSWAEDLLDPTALKEDGILNADAVLRMWSEHASGEKDWNVTLWRVLMFRSWQQRYG